MTTVYNPNHFKTGKESKKPNVEPENSELSKKRNSKLESSKKPLALLALGLGVGLTVYSSFEYFFGSEKNKAEAEAEALSASKTQIESTQASNVDAPKQETTSTNSKPNTNTTTSNESSSKVNSSSETSSANKESEVTAFALTSPVDLIEYRAEFKDDLSSTDKIKGLFYGNSSECDRVGSYCLERGLSNGNLRSLYGKNWEYKYVDINSSPEDIVDNMNIKLAVAMASVNESGESDPEMGLAVLYYLYDSNTVIVKNGFTSNTLTNCEETIQNIKKPSQIINQDVVISSSEVFKCLDSNHEAVNARVITVQTGDKSSKDIVIERKIKNFKGETITDLKLADEVDINLSDEAALSSVKLTIVK